MKAAVNTSYGPAEAVTLTDLPTPAPGPKEVLIRVRASSLTTADWRLRASAFPRLMWLPGRLMFGLFRPRDTVRGSDIAGEVVAVGHAVTRFSPGDRIFGNIGQGGHAEYALASEDATLLHTPDSLDDASAAALPFGAIAALVFLRDVAQVRPGQNVLIVGGSGGVGAYAVQIARDLGAHVTAVASAANARLMRELGAERTIDYRTENVAGSVDRYDLVFDTVGATTLPQMRRALRRNGLFLPLNFTGAEIWQLLRSKLLGGPRIVLHVNGDSRDDLQWLLDAVTEGRLRPVIDRRFPLDRIVEAHRHVEGRHRRGAVVIDVALPDRVARAA
ncbi:NAD(P)-dependent alcohol dehydrogenase [Aestuariicoccus sp. MJ-SS9]|uniref:NAD(P)-dependent alcohol dehydrogenase n=1 Tax=Aestuariicoccus sp. MJ-SS9 TaxID=3079855 RepID=UPI0029145839|nr:NAD(P)-dependent alcohol dehydrogenase [Aestuariicoccus sp. MJ-SS9]MDU8910002.1 NAD(P)-dependent alcohol dehydrogenase [Aestuariicoccus sp. MJ-SS9]